MIYLMKEAGIEKRVIWKQSSKSVPGEYRGARAFEDILKRRRMEKEGA